DRNFCCRCIKKLQESDEILRYSYRFPKEPEQRKRWLELAQRDEGSLRMSSCLCSRHFEPSCFTLSGEGQLTLQPDAVPTIIPVTVPTPHSHNQDEVVELSQRDFISKATN
uniref:THAP domain-containing protein 1 n=1 Tax=Mola mola TaxID=94237 RepID=A0A3Q3WIQ5_MOLML